MVARLKLIHYVAIIRKLRKLNSKYSGFKSVTYKDTLSPMGEDIFIVRDNYPLVPVIGGSMCVDYREALDLWLYYGCSDYINKGQLDVTNNA